MLFVVGKRVTNNITSFSNSAGHPASSRQRRGRSHRPKDKDPLHKGSLLSPAPVTSESLALSSCLRVRRALSTLLDMHDTMVAGFPRDLSCPSW
eukprot:6403185-Pyramimonas_sp.AAC.1